MKGRALVAEGTGGAKSAARSRRSARRAAFDALDQIEIEPDAAAKAAGLRYVSDSGVGIARQPARGGFRYVGTDGTPVRDKATIGRIEALAIPPAWTEVWICPSPRGHLQATGRDAKRRKQYRYHPRWREVRDEAKFGRLIAFGQSLPQLRERVAADLAAPGTAREKILAAVVRLLETTLIRVGNDEYARTNESYGLTTLQNDHVDVNGSSLRFRFRGKSGVEHEVDVRDRRLATIVKRCQDLPGQDLFQYTGEDGEPHRVTSEDVNAYLHEAIGDEFTTKDFRTWAGTVLAARALHACGEFDTQSQANQHIVAAIDAVAKRLGNTRAVCRSCYVHPAVIDAYLDGTLPAILSRRIDDNLNADLHDLDPDEAAVLTLIRERAPSVTPAAG